MKKTNTNQNRWSIALVFVTVIFLLAGCSKTVPTSNEVSHQDQTVLNLNYWEMDIAALSAAFSELGWDTYHYKVGETSTDYYLGTIFDVPAYARVTLDPNSGLVNSIHFESRFYLAGDETIQKAMQSLHDEEWSLARIYSEYSGNMAEVMAIWLIQARDAMKNAGGVAGEYAATLTGNTATEIQAVLQSYLADNTIQSFQIGERWYLFEDGTLGGFDVQTMELAPNGTPYFCASLELYCNGYQDPLGFKPEADGYASHPDDTPFIITR